MSFSPNVRYESVFLGVLCAGLQAAILSGCSLDKVREASKLDGKRPVSTGAAMLSPVRLRGGDNIAWLTSDGDLGDNRYCRCNLRLPLDSSIAWDYSYSSAEVGPGICRDLVHFDGLLAGSGRSSVIFVLDSASGKELSRQSAFFALPTTQNSAESFAGFMFSPHGALTSVDEIGRFYCWGWPQDGLVLRSVSSQMQVRLAGFVALDDTLVGSDGTQLSAMEQSDLDKSVWTRQLGWLPRGVVALDDGTTAAWTPHGVVSCNNPDGSERWRSDEGERLSRVILEPSGSRVYVAASEGRLICRTAEQGNLLWEFNWRGLVPVEEQSERVTRVQEILDGTRFRGTRVERMPLEPQLICESPHGVMLVLQTGDVALLDPADGKLRWHNRLQSLTDSAIGFDNGILLHLVYYPVASYQASLASMMALLDRPSWAGEIDVNVAAPGRERSRRGQERPTGVQGRFMVLDPLTGAVISQFAEENVAEGSIVPAGGNLVVAVEPDGQGSRNEKNRIVAYSWLEAEGN